MNYETIIGSAIGVIVVGAGALFLFVKVFLSDWKAWRERVETKIDKLDPDRLGEHFTRVHTLSNDVFKALISIVNTEKDLADHEVRLRQAEAQILVIRNGGKS